MKSIKLLMVSALLSGFAIAPAFSFSVQPYQPKPLVKKSLEDYKACDTEALAKQLDTDFSVTYMVDDSANYNYYLVRTRHAMNVDKIRAATCAYIKQNNCYLYWGNVVNIAMFSQQKAAWFPTDTSPHYMLSPLITCNKQQKATKKS